MPLTSLHFASEVDAVGFLANTVGCLGSWARLLEGYDAGRTLEAILGTVVLRSWEEGGVQGTKRHLGTPPLPNLTISWRNSGYGPCIYRSRDRLSSKVLAQCYSAQMRSGRGPHTGLGAGWKRLKAGGKLALTGHRALIAAVSLAAVRVGHHVVLGAHGGGHETRVAVAELHAGLVAVH